MLTIQTHNQANPEYRKTFPDTNSSYIRQINDTKDLNNLDVSKHLPGGKKSWQVVCDNAFEQTQLAAGYKKIKGSDGSIFFKGKDASGNTIYSKELSDGKGSLIDTKTLINKNGTGINSVVLSHDYNGKPSTKDKVVGNGLDYCG